MSEDLSGDKDEEVYLTQFHKITGDFASIVASDATQTTVSPVLVVDSSTCHMLGPSELICAIHYLRMDRQETMGLT